MPRKIAIIGAGIAGLASAISLSNELTPKLSDLEIIVYERSKELSTAGGAISLTPIAQRHLDDLGVLSKLNQMGPEAGVEVDTIDLFALNSGRRLGPLRLTASKDAGCDNYKGRRVKRISLALAMVAAIEDLPKVSILYGKKLTGGNTTDDGATLIFDDGTSASADLALGCDGVHSPTRTRIVDPGNESKYSGVSFVQSITSAVNASQPTRSETTSLHIGRHGSILTSYCDPNREKLFVAAVLKVNEILIERYYAALEGDAAAQNSMKMSLRYLVRTQSNNSRSPALRKMVDHAEDWALCPVYQVRPGRPWHRGRIMLLGDAAHAMPPRDESTTHALEDAIIFSRTLSHNIGQPIANSFQEFECERRAFIDNAFDESFHLWQRNQDLAASLNYLKDPMSPISRPASPDVNVERIPPLSVPLPMNDSFSDLSVCSLTQEYLGSHGII
ncbi:FAD/NAD(P)-binding domain-containing protein [Aspergillus campestris IBT 28561]|uniref:FAD/NAD(P)-binding domain-containing protein n=1 Tax=Aspergillus campestris (strain IBT 28561) TaxID=1392248 RepID=A0A2I1DHC3_ASPC2|nr:FAD/NAD(P)-binding domain-containing protein [Aspergillus campestris IBT 28561]PKY09273.1 FAD/NAD(P)-binding domain-containing protein [Aspergillus campestris IBT 28561]